MKNLTKTRLLYVFCGPLIAALAWVVSCLFFPTLSTIILYSFLFSLIFNLIPYSTVTRKHILHSVCRVCFVALLVAGFFIDVMFLIKALSFSIAFWVVGQIITLFVRDNINAKPRFN